MARPGVTYQDVSSAASELKGQGKSITIETIRAHLGTGSIGTINKYLRQWRDAQNSTLRISSQTNIPDELISVLKGLWDRVVTQSSEQFKPIEEELRNEIAALEAELEKYRGNNQRWQKIFNQWQQEKAALVNEKLTLEQALEFAHKENQSLHGKYDGLLQQLQEKQERVEELHRLHQQTQSNLEHYRESAREQRLLDQQQFEHEKQQLQLEIKPLKEQLVVQQHKYSELSQEYQLKERSYAQLEQQCTQARQSVDNLKDKLDQLEKENITYQQSSQHWQNQFSELNTKFENNLTLLISLQGDNRVLTNQLIDMKKLLQDTQDQNKLMANGKLELIREKGSLEGQLKQLQKMAIT